MPTIIGAPTDLMDITPFCGIELAELYKGAEQLLSEGVPMEVQAALPTGDLLRIAATLRRYHELIARFVHDYEGCKEQDDVDAAVEVVDQMIEDAQALLSAPPPSAFPGQSLSI